MGYNSIILLMNDSLHEVREDVEFGANVANACSEFMSSRERSRGVEIRTRHRSRAGVVLAEDHADVVNVVVAGGNTGVHLGGTHNGGRVYEEPDRFEALKRVLATCGYKLTRKRGEVVSELGRILHDPREERIARLEGELAAARAEIKALKKGART